MHILGVGSRGSKDKVTAKGLWWVVRGWLLAMAITYVNVYQLQRARALWREVTIMTTYVLHRCSQQSTDSM